MYTRAVFAEFTVYNANVNLFCIVTLILESTAVGEEAEQSFPSMQSLHVLSKLTVPFLLYRSFSVWQRGSERPSLPVHRWLSVVPHGLAGVLFPLHRLLHVFAGQFSNI